MEDEIKCNTESIYGFGRVRERAKSSLIQILYGVFGVLDVERNQF